MKDSSDHDDCSDRSKTGTCPSCNKKTTFAYLGLQRWPKRVSERSGMPAEQIAWQCQECQTTLLDLSIEWE